MSSILLKQVQQSSLGTAPGYVRIFSDIDNGGQLRYIDANGTTYEAMGPTGPSGATGSQGEPGATGSVGATGASGPSGPIVTQTTYDNLVNTLIPGNSLIENSYYEITDFRTVYDRPNYFISGQLKPTTTYFGSTQSLIVFAASNNSIDINAFQPDYPSDSIKYDISWTQSELNGYTASGRIVERIDEYGNRTDYDHRQVEMIRYRSYVRTSELTGNISSIDFNSGYFYGIGTTFSSQLSVGDIVLVDTFTYSGYNVGLKVKTISDDLTAEFWKDPQFTGSMSSLNSKYYSSTASSYYLDWEEVYVNQENENDYTLLKTFQYDSESPIMTFNNYLGDYHRYLTSEGLSHSLPNVVFSENCYDNKIGDISGNFTLPTNSNSNVTGALFGRIDVSSIEVTKNRIGNNFQNNTISNDFINNEIGDNFSHNLIGDLMNMATFSSNNISNDFSNNVINGNFNHNQIGASFSNNIIGLTNSTINTFDNNIIGNYFQNNAFNSICIFTNNVIRNYFKGNAGAGGYPTPSTLSNFENNNIGEYFYYNILAGTYFKNNNIGNYFGNNSSPNQINSINFSYNHIQNYFGSNESQTEGGNYLDVIDFVYNSIGNHFLGNTAAGDFKFNKFSDFTSYNQFESTTNNNVGWGCVNNLFGNSKDNVIGFSFSQNIFGNEFFGNKIGHRFFNNQISGGFGFDNSQTIGNEIGDDFANNTIGQYFFNNKISSQFQSNQTFNFFQNNEIKVPVSSVNFKEFYGNILTFTYSSGTSSDGTYSLISGSSSIGSIGVSASFDIVVISGSVSSVGLTNSGNYYLPGEYITIDGTLIGGVSGTGDVVVYVNTVSATPSVYEAYSSIVFNRQPSTNRLSYFDSNDSLIIKDINT